MSRALVWARRNWVLLAGLALFVGSDYKFRVRDSRAAISGSVDFFILLELALYGAVGLYVLMTWSSVRQILHRAPELICAGFYVLLLVLSLARTPYPTYGAVRVVETLILFGLILAIAARAERADLHRLAHGFLILVAGSVVYGALVPSPPVTPLQEGRFTWLAVHSTVSGVFLSIAVVVGFVYLTARHPRPGPRWPWWFYAVLLVLVTTGLIAAHTRSAVLAAVVGTVASLWAYHGGRRRAELLVGSVLGISLIALTALPVIESYFVRGESVERLQTLNSRTDLWTVAWEAIELEPLYGYGIGASQGMFQEEVGLGGGHNAAVNVAVDLGFVGLAVWLALVAGIAVGILRLPRTSTDGLSVDRALLIAVFLAIHVCGIFYSGPGAVANVAATGMFLVLGWLVCVRRTVGADQGAIGTRTAT